MWTVNNKKVTSQNVEILSVEPFSFGSNSISIGCEIQFNEGNGFKVINTCKPQYGGKLIQDEQYYYVDQKGEIYPGPKEVLTRIQNNNADALDYNYLTAGGSIGIDCLLYWCFCIPIKDMGINASGIYIYNANLSVYDMDDVILASYDYNIKAQYDKTGKDESCRIII